MNSRLVSEALAEREVLLKMAPHIAFPTRFRLPHRPHLRPAWMIRIGCLCTIIWGNEPACRDQLVCVLAQIQC